MFLLNHEKSTPRAKRWLIVSVPFFLRNSPQELLQRAFWNCHKMVQINLKIVMKQHHIETSWASPRV